MERTRKGAATSDTDLRHREAHISPAWHAEGSLRFAVCVSATEVAAPLRPLCFEAFSSTYSWVVMPNHLHALFSMIGASTLAKVSQSWTGASSREINRILGRSGTFWQKDYFDRMVRTSEHFWRCVRYIRKNPVNLPFGSFPFREADWVTRALDL
jgi:REP element-mobilizing transposase RayT